MYTLACLALSALPQSPPALTHGPFRGAAEPTAVRVWARAAAPGAFALHLRRADGSELPPVTAQADAAHDQTLQWRVDGLAADQGYDWWITAGATTVQSVGAAPLRTAPAHAAATGAIVFGSCSNDLKVPQQHIWARIDAMQPQALVLLGDTPYIDSDDLEVRRRRYREFFAFAPVRSTLAAIPTWSTWDDHDYALNDQFGANAKASTARPVFVDYHAQDGGEDGRGIHTRLRYGPLEVFLLDTRTFADGEPSPFAADRRSLLGKRQLDWLQAGLRASDAPFKVLACGLIWNGAVRADKEDTWAHWQHERDGLLAWIGARHIDGVVLVSGDVHRSRLIVHPVHDLAGYDVPEFVTSPLAADVLPKNNVALPGLAFDAGEPEACLLLRAERKADGATLTARYVAGDGRALHERTFAAADLRAQPR